MRIVSGLVLTAAEVRTQKVSPSRPSRLSTSAWWRAAGVSR